MQRINLVAALMAVFSKHAAGETQLLFQGVATRDCADRHRRNRAKISPELGASVGALELVRLA
jgi:hypothetical protein